MFDFASCPRFLSRIFFLGPTLTILFLVVLGPLYCGSQVTKALRTALVHTCQRSIYSFVLFKPSAQWERTLPMFCLTSGFRIWHVMNFEMRFLLSLLTDINTRDFFFFLFFFKIATHLFLMNSFCCFFLIIQFISIADSTDVGQLLLENMLNPSLIIKLHLKNALMPLEFIIYLFYFFRINLFLKSRIIWNQRLCQIMRKLLVWMQLISIFEAAF